MMNGYYMNNERELNEARGIINQMNVDDLKKLMNNDNEVTKLVQNLSSIQQLETIRESLKENIKSLAMRNLDKEPTLIHEKEKLAELHEKLGKMREEYRSIRGQYDDQTGETNPEMIYILLQTAAADLERATEQTAEDFFYGEKSEEEVTEFERRFIEDRKRAHELKIKAEKFNELMQVSQSTSGLNFNQHIRSSGYR
ncbi:unnamed protein product [Adineta steineri]|uniref:VPS37 C-terminal domain-containing protein n=1 Tax=Adineta steineri TaxID=433720 RepID=A0A814YLX6_9BILA|nr:unnamed protein product [Adineta steineri]CAF1100133.1 unnamed protein product [Adineta steineri]CAF1231286.1 unnamed protein product [Adineta steineri]CAF3681774.1 unnamed protein product [Adineta steineri]CAF3723764.1 unnamed protein product [Adineta steineri]